MWVRFPVRSQPHFVTGLGRFRFGLRRRWRWWRRGVLGVGGGAGVDVVRLGGLVEVAEDESGERGRVLPGKKTRLSQGGAFVVVEAAGKYRVRDCIAEFPARQQDGRVAEWSKAVNLGSTPAFGNG